MTGLVSLGVLIATTHALKGATLVGSNVIESPLDPIEAVLDKFSGQPVIAVYVSSEKQEIISGSFALLRGDKDLHITIQIFLPEECVVSLDGRVFSLDTRSRGIEVAFATIWRQCSRALLMGDGAWTLLWQRFISRITSIVTEPFLLEIGKVRVAAREITISCSTVDEPRFGSPPEYVWADFVTALRSEAEYGPAIADLVAFEIAAPSGLPNWQIARGLVGLSDEAANALGVGAVPGAEAEPPVAGVTITTPRGDLLVYRE